MRIACCHRITATVDEYSGNASSRHQGIQGTPVRGTIGSDDRTCPGNAHSVVAVAIFTPYRVGIFQDEGSNISVADNLVEIAQVSDEDALELFGIKSTGTGLRLAFVCLDENAILIRQSLDGRLGQSPSSVEDAATK